MIFLELGPGEILLPCNMWWNKTRHYLNNVGFAIRIGQERRTVVAILEAYLSLYLVRYVRLERASGEAQPILDQDPCPVLF